MSDSSSKLTPCKRKAEDGGEGKTMDAAGADTSISITESNKRPRAASIPFRPSSCMPLNPFSGNNGHSISLANALLTSQGAAVRGKLLKEVLSINQEHLSANAVASLPGPQAASQLNGLSSRSTSSPPPQVPPAPTIARAPSSLAPGHPKKEEQEADQDMERKVPAMIRPGTVVKTDTHDTPTQRTKMRRSSASMSMSTSTASGSTTSGQGQEEQILSDVDAVDSIFRRVAFISLAVWFVLVGAVYTLHCRAQKEVEDAQATAMTGLADEDALERRVPQTAFFILLVGNILQLSPLTIERVKTFQGDTICVQGVSTAPTMSGIMVAATVIQVVAMTTNALLGWGPRAVVIDPVTGSRVYLWRWCEWIPLSGFMTLLAESADVPTHAQAWRKPMLFSFSQTLSNACGIILPFCQSGAQWWLVMLVSCLTFLPIFPRARARRDAFIRAQRGTTVLERENFDRRRFAYYLMVMCSSFWSILVGLYFVNMIIHTTTTTDHWLRFPSLAMTCDTIADVMAKVIYTRIIVDAHQAVFASDLRMARQLSEFKQLMSTLWVASSDVIVISTKQTKYRKATMFSPSFLKLVDAHPPSLKNSDLQEEDANWDSSSYASSISGEQSPQSAALVLETDRGKLVSAYYVDTATIGEDPYRSRADSQRVLLAHKDLRENEIVQALRIANIAWTFRSYICKGEAHAESLRALSIVSCDPTRTNKVMCEMKVSNHSQQTAIAVVRDVTERYRRFEAETRAHAETIARQRDMHKANRFTRHEVKNGLLEGIELCRTLGQSLDKLQSMLKDQDYPTSTCPDRMKSTLQRSSNHVEDDTLKSLVDLDGTLRWVLDTVLAEVMAREVVHEVYQPRLEELDVPSMLVSSLGMSKDRMPVTVRGGSMPKLLLDAQLIGHIHRNSVSNALKYGKQGGLVETYIEFDDEKQEFRMEVVNEPGHGHSALLALGESASEFVFAQGVRLQPHMKGNQEKKIDSSGDGAWIMQKCAKTMNGACDIQFLQDRTRFTFICPVAPVTKSCQRDYNAFTVPDNVFGIGIDDSKIQRKLLSRIFEHAGVDSSRQILLGETHEDIVDFESTLINLMDEHPGMKFLIIVDEHLDYDNIALKEVHYVHSGSLIMKQILDHMSKEQTDRLLVLMRSANDSAVDIAMYTQRTHGYFPKAIMQRNHTREILAPMWFQRFPEDSSLCQPIRN